MAELDRREISYQVGRVIVGAARGEEAAIREALATVGVNRVLVYNRSALMWLPAGVSTGTGVQNALRFLGLSFHDVLALGDAENDVPFFEVRGWRACPADGMAVLKERADWNSRGTTARRRRRRSWVPSFRASCRCSSGCHWCQIRSR